MNMRNQISGSISLDVSSLADAIAERLKPGAAFTPLSPTEAADALSEALTFATDLEDHTAAQAVLRRLERIGITLMRLPQETTREALPEAHPSWFERTND